MVPLGQETEQILNSGNRLTLQNFIQSPEHLVNVFVRVTNKIKIELDLAKHSQFE